MKLKISVFTLALLGAFICSANAQENFPPQQLKETISLDDILQVLQPEHLQTQQLARAKIRVLEFSSNNITDIDLTANTPAQYKELTILLKACQPNQSDTKGKDVAWLEIFEPSKNKPELEEQEEEVIPTFAGWMFNTLTDISTLDHPKYDVRLLKCLEPIEVKPLEPEPAEISAPEVEELE